jgi:hypothetical protein
MNWRVVVTVIVAFVIGAGGGAVAEHVRLKNASDKPGATATTSAGNNANPAANDWFGAKATQACPALKNWTAAGAASGKAFRMTGAWTAKRAALVAAIKDAGAAYSALEPFANPAGKAELQFLVAHQEAVNNAVAKASSLPVFDQARKKLQSPRAQRDFAIVGVAARRCTA